MPVVDRKKERQIVERAIQRGFSEDQVKAAVLKFREQGIKPTAAPTTEGPGFFERELTGQTRAPEGGLGKRLGQGLFQAPLGSRGLLGVGQLPGLVAGQFSALGTGRQLAESQQQLADRTSGLLRQARTVEPERGRQLRGVAQENIRTLAGGQVAQRELQEFERTPLEALGITANALITASTLGGGSIITQPVKVTAQNVAKRIAQAAANAGIVGTEIGIAGGLSEGEPLGDAIIRGLQTGAISGILGGGIQGSIETVRGLTAPQITERLFNSGLGVSKRVAVSGRSPSRELIRKGTVGTAKSIFDKQEQVIRQSEQEVKRILANSNKTVPMASYFKRVADEINKKVGNVSGEGVTALEVQRTLQTKMPNVHTLLGKQSLTIKEFNRLRQLMDSTQGDSAFLVNQLPADKQLFRLASDFARVTVQFTEKATKAPFKDWSTAIAANKALTGEIAKPHVLRHMFSLGGALTGVGLPKVAAFELGQTTFAKTAAAVTLSRFNDLISRDQTVLQELLQGVISQVGRTAISESLPK